MNTESSRKVDTALATAPETDAPWHSCSPDAAIQRLGSSVQGLDDAALAERRQRYGENRLPEAPPESALRRFLRQFNNVLIYVLLAAGSVTAVLGHVVDTVVIFAVVLVNAIIGYIQEGRAAEALAAIRDMLAPEARVLRNGRRRTVPAQQLVPGDVVILEAGDRVPADVRLVSAHGLKIEEAALTGESVAVDKDTQAVPADVALGDRRCMAFSGTLVVAGQGHGLVVATGAQTQIGRISELVTQLEAGTTPLLRQMDLFAKRLTAVILTAALGILLFGIFVSNISFSDMFMAVVGLSVAAIPEGLPAILTVTLAIGVQGMAKLNAIVRRLPAIEALGSVTVICSDKTGTLTKNEMTVAAVVVHGGEYVTSGAGYSPHGGLMDSSGAELDAAGHRGMEAIAVAAALCNDAELSEHEGVWRVDGDPMEGALLAFAAKAGSPGSTLRSTLPRTDLIPFDAQHRFMATLHHDHSGDALVCVKGAPERILSMCTQVLLENGDTTALDVEHWQSLSHAVASRGQRVLALAQRHMPDRSSDLLFEDVESGLVLLGLLGLIDPPRDEAISAVADCRAAGIRVKMITGDHAGTALAIGRELGLGNTQRALTGVELDAMDSAALRHAVIETDVFARTSPEHKLRLVEALQDSGQVVAMTGDGLNDSPALKRADIGIAMGMKGTEAAKEAAEIVLADDNFASIAAAVRAGRNVYDNLKKAIVFLLPVNGGESLALVLAILLGLTLPITPAQILWVNMVSSVLLAMTLAFEKAEPGIMQRPPRDPAESIFSRFLLWRVLLVSLIFCAGVFSSYSLAISGGASVEASRTLAVNTLVAMEVFYLFSVRYLSGTSLTLRGVLGTRPVLLAITAVSLLQLLFTYAPFMHTLFETRSLSLLALAQTLVAGVALLVILELDKYWQRRFRTPPHREPATG